jgi:hypothetical protein
MPAKKFSWSWSRLKNFRSCPKRHWHLDINKDIKDPESDDIRWGKVFHEAMAARIQGKPLPQSLAHYDKLPALISNYMADVECEMALNSEFKPTGWFASDTWLRAKVDVLMIHPAKHMALALDWKTGKMNGGDYEQLAITAQMIFSTYQEVDIVRTAYVWSKYDDDTKEVFRREDMIPLWAKLLPEVKQMEKAAEHMDYPPKPSGLCVRFCPVTSCPYHGKGTR